MAAGKSKALKWLALCALLTYAGVMAMWASHRSYADQCRGVTIEIKGDHRNDSVIKTGILSHLKKYINPIGQSRNKLNTQAIEKWIGVLNNLENVEVGFDSHSFLRIVVHPLMPEMRIFTPAGESYYVNSAGKHMDAKAEFFSNVPIVMGAFSNAMPPTMLKPVLAAIKKDKTIASLVTMLEVKAGGDIILIPRIKGHVINIGDTSNLQLKFRNLKAFYKKVMPYRGWNTYDTISLKFKQQIVATRANKQTPSHGAIISVDDEIAEESTLAGTNLIEDTPKTASPQKETTKTNI